MEKKTGEIGALQHFETAAEKGNFGCTYKVCKSFSGWKRIARRSKGKQKSNHQTARRAERFVDHGEVKGDVICLPDGRNGADVAVPARLRFSCGKGDGGLRFGWEGRSPSTTTPPCVQSSMRSQGGAVYFPNHSAERGIRQEA